MGKLLITAGILLLALGLVLQVWPAALSWFGRLPGDLRIERENGVLLIPLTSMILVSLALSLILNLFLRR